MATGAAGSRLRFICAGNQGNRGALFSGLRQPHSAVFQGEPLHCRARRGRNLECPTGCTLEFDLARRDLGLQGHPGADRADDRKIPPFEGKDVHDASLAIGKQAVLNRSQESQQFPLRCNPKCLGFLLSNPACIRFLSMATSMDYPLVFGATFLRVATSICFASTSSRSGAADPIKA
jgi:hypothetical protein